MSADQGRYEVRRHMVDGVVALWWCAPGKADTLEFVTGEPEVRLPLLAKALAVWHEEHRRPRTPAPREPVVALASKQRRDEERET